MKKTLTFALICLCASITYAQKFKVDSGHLKNLKTINAYTVKFKYDNLNIPNFESEADFLDDKMSKREEKEAGAGEVFKKSWFADREDRYEPKFIESFNKRFNDGEVSIAKENNAAYTMLIETHLIYPGYNVGVWRQNSKIETTISVFETSNPNNILYAAHVTKVEGNGAAGYDFNSGYRISEAYAKLAKEFAKKIRKVI